MCHARPDAADLLMLDVQRIEQLRAAAWFDYLDVVRSAREESERRYHELEPYAWELLQSNLGKLQQFENRLTLPSGGRAGHVSHR